MATGAFVVAVVVMALQADSHRHVLVLHIRYLGQAPEPGARVVELRVLPGIERIDIVAWGAQVAAGQAGGYAAGILPRSVVGPRDMDG